MPGAQSASLTGAVELEFQVHTTRGWVQVAPDSAEQVEAALRRYVPPPDEERILAATLGTSNLRQEAIKGLGPLSFPLLGDSEPYLGYTAPIGGQRQFPGDDRNKISRFGLGSLVPLYTFELQSAGELLYRWTTPQASGPAGQGQGLYVILVGSQQGTELVGEGANQVEVTFNYTSHSAGTDSEGRPVTTISVEVFLGEQHLMSVGPVDVVGIPVAFPINVRVRSPFPGTHRMEVLADGVVRLDETYDQRGLTLAQPLQDYEVPADQTVTIQNELLWDYGPAPTDLEEARWEVEVWSNFGEGVAPRLVANKSGDGRFIDAEFNVQDLSLARTGTSSGTIRLVPAGTMEDIRLQEGAPDGTYRYLVRGRALAYRSPDPAQNAYYGIEGNGFAPGRRMVMVRNAEFSIDPFSPTEEEPNTKLTANIYALGFEYPFHAEWQVKIVDEAGQVVHPLVAEGAGDWVEVDWDGTDAFGNPIDPQTVNFVITAQVCSGLGETPPPIFIRNDSVLLQGDDCLLAQETVALNMGAAELDLLKDGAPVTRLEPSFLYRVRQFKEFLKRPGHDEPGGQVGELRELGQVSQVEARVVASGMSFPATLRLTVTTLPDQCGHQHALPVGLLRPQRTTPPATDPGKRELAGEIAGHTDSSDTIELTVAAPDTPVSVYYLAPITSGETSFELTSSSGRLLARRTLAVEKAGLQRLQDTLASRGIRFAEDAPGQQATPGPEDAVLFIGQTSRHPANHYGTPSFNIRLAALARVYHRDFGETLFFNDMSLECSGKFSVAGDPSLASEHFEHRWGENIDLNNETVREQRRSKELERLCKKAGLAVYAELPDRHYHLRPLEAKP